MIEEIPHADESKDLLFDEFEPDDPRRGPHTQEARAEAAAMAGAPNRWHARNPHVDWFAVRLQVGRGLKAREAAAMFNIGHSTIDRRRLDEEWARWPGDADRRRLAALVWLAGIERLAPDDATSREALKAASEWRLKQAAPPPAIWREKDPLDELLGRVSETR